MRTIFASAAVAATAAAVPDIRDVVQFLGGFLDEWSMENNLTELETCATDAEGQLTLAFQIMDELSSGQHVKAATDMAKFTNQLKVTLADCESMQDDLARIKAWASLFKDQTELVSTITKNVLKHPTGFAKDIKHTEKAWMAGSYQEAGKDFADLLELGIGPVKAEMDAVMPLLDLISVPDFLAGFVYGMVGESHLTEIESCYAGATPLAHYAEDFLKDLKHFQVIDALKNMEEFVYHMQLDLEPCHAMSDDLAAIKAWGAQFKDPMSLVEGVTKHFLFHKKKIMADWSTEKSDWSLGEYFQAGKVFADIAVLTIGPIKEPTPAPEALPTFEIKSIPEFVAGFVEGMVGESHLTEIESCYNSTSPLLSYAETILSDITHLRILDAIKQFEFFLYHMQLDLQPCLHGAMGDDIRGIENWGLQFTDPLSLIESATKHVLLHKKKLTKDWTAEKADWGLHEYFKGGKDFADIAIILFGPIKETPAALPTFEIKEIPEFVGGFLEGLVGDSHLTEIETCYTSASPLVGYAETLLSDLKHGNIFDAIKQFEHLTHDMQADLAPCKGGAMDQDIQGLENWAAQFKDPLSLIPEVTKHFVLHKKKIENDWTTEKADWGLHEYFQAGKVMADIATILVGPVEEAPATFLQ